MAAIDRLMELVPPPRRVPDVDIDWPGIENELGAPLPIDYKVLIARYGRGSFDDFLYVHQPRDDNMNLDLLQGHRAALDALRGYAAFDFTEPVPYGIEEGNEQLLTWGGTDNGDCCYWIITGEDPSKWPIAVNEPGPEWAAYSGTLTEFLLAVLSRDYRCPIFPEGFPSERPEFNPI